MLNETPGARLILARALRPMGPRAELRLIEDVEELANEEAALRAHRASVSPREYEAWLAEEREYLRALPAPRRPS